VALITIIAVVGMASSTLRPILVIATLLALPCGVIALVGLYVLTGLFNSIADGFSNVSTSVGGCTDGHCWSAGTPVGAQGFLFSFCIVVLFASAALANVLILRALLCSRPSASPEFPEQPS
jgi:hypothetical protein